MNRLKPLVNNYDLWSAYQEYLREEREVAIKQLTRCTDPNDLLRHQGDLRRIDKMLNLKNEVNRHDT